MKNNDNIGKITKYSQRNLTYITGLISGMTI